MAIVQVPVSSSPSELFSISLDQVTYRMKFNWVEKLGGWYMSLYRSNGDPMFLGHRVNYNSPLSSKYSYLSESPQGFLLLVDTTNTKLSPDFDSISTTDKLYYVSLDEVI